LLELKRITLAKSVASLEGVVPAGSTGTIVHVWSSGTDCAVEFTRPFHAVAAVGGALRAVQDAIHHSSLAMIRSLGTDARTQTFVEVTIGVQQPEKVDTEAVKASLPHGIVTMKAVKGGLDVIDRGRGDNAVIADAAVAVRLELG
jgi:uncharacterized protein (TIGR02058 family)